MDVLETKLITSQFCRKWRNSLLDVRSYRGADVFSDHYLVIGQFKIKLLANMQRRPKIAKRINVAKLKHEEIRRQYTEELAVNFIQNNDQHNWDEVATTLRRTGENLGFIQYERKEWITDDTWNLIGRRKPIKLRLKNSSGIESNTLRIEYTRLNKEVKKSARQDKRRFV